MTSPAGAAGGRRPALALAFATAAAFSAWNPLSAPFGLVVGLGALLLSGRALRSSRQGAERFRALAVAALVLSLGAVVWSGAVIARTAGVGRGPGGTEVVPAPPPGEQERALDEAAAATREARERARSELDGTTGGAAGGAEKAR